ncbi:MAG: cyclopropane-fatty-acyl-phospholipid synthase family protein [Candidatus Competibacterales bacterium]|nr:cyclopropane-fatty-acyl-phospholipid synthase family protein [Candidatus Competibacterales bacterium]
MKRDQAQSLSRNEITPANRKKASGTAVRLLRWLLDRAGDPPISVVLWDGRELQPRRGSPQARLQITDRGALVKLLAHPDLQFGELYSEGRLRVEGDLVRFMEILNNALPDYQQRDWLARLLGQFYLIKRNTLDRARDNIYHHYDIGNDFYRLWLDERMVYTCAYFRSPEVDLEQAQVDKLDHVCRKLRLQPGEIVAEAGCGWGALALHMARHYGVTVKAYNISREQLAYARGRARDEGLAERVEFIEGDYREIQGRFDAFASVGMLEHVGVKHYRELGAVIDRVLAPHGRGLIHTIGRNRPQPMNAWIQRRIFPGAYPPTLAEMAPLFEPWRFSVLDVENLRLHYARTLQHWLERFEGEADRVREMFDEAFVRSWRLYLAGSEAAFTVGELQLFQVLFARYDVNSVPLTREYIYQGD